MNGRITCDIGEGLVILLIGTLAIWGASLVPPPPEGETWAGVLPMGAAIALAGTGAWLAWAGYTAKKDNEPANCLDRSMFGTLKLVLLSILYYLAILKFGYELPTAFVGPIALWFFGVRSKIGLILSFILYPFFFHIVFFKLLGVFPPYGEIFDLLDYLRG
jgi:putative tricarboxylic transport membrane protein